MQIQSTTLVEIAARHRKVDSPQIITLIGGGGKTSLMFLWARVLKEQGFSVITATTTKLCNESRSGFVVAHPATFSAAQTLLENSQQRKEILTLTGFPLASTGKLSGISPEWVDQLSRTFPDTIFLVEGDGSAGRSIKGHLPHEPVIPADTSLLVPIIGLDVLGKTLDADYVHRPNVFSEITGIRAGECVGPAAVLTILLHKNGYLKQAPATAQVFPFFNKVETFHLKKEAFSLSQKLLTAGHPQIQSVLAGSVRQNCFVRLS